MQIPIKIPEGMPPVQAKALVAYLQQNPDVAKKAHEQAQHMLKTPGMAQAFMQVCTVSAYLTPCVRMCKTWVCMFVFV